MYGLFLVRETQYGGTVVEFMDYCHQFLYMKDARKALLNQITILSTREDSNDTQPTMNNKDFFHFYIKEPNGFEEKRYIAISKVYRSNKKSIIMKLDVIDKVKSF